MSEIDHSILSAILVNDGIKLFNQESDILEYKSEFDWENKAKRAKYMKSMAAFCNNKGGYLVFGIEDKTNNIVGVIDFENVDSADIANAPNFYFSPSISIQVQNFKLSDKYVGVIHIEKHNEMPAICIKDYDNILKDGAFFYRYSGKSDHITGADLIHVFHNLKAKDSKELVDLKKIELKQNAMPRFIGGSGTSVSNNFEFNLSNSGKRAKITSVTVISGGVNLWRFGDLPIWVEENHPIVFNGATLDGVPAAMRVYNFEIIYEDAIGTNYKILCKGQGGGISSITDPIELN